jgi:hypothetical protein
MDFADARVLTLNNDNPRRIESLYGEIVRQCLLAFGWFVWFCDAFLSIGHAMG